MAMMKELEVVYNGSCPICSTEVAVYRRHAEAAALPIAFTDLNEADLARIGLDRERAARRFHVLRQGEVLSGVPAFLALWQSIPRYSWLARIVGLPGIRQAAVIVYDRLAAPLLYRMHLRRVARQCSVEPEVAPTEPARVSEREGA
jgi:predicted DCC family thiol-disulfide oxidoreductase YuxK